MQHSQINSNPETKEIGPPRCDSCAVPMWLVQIEPDKPDHDRRTYECPVCDNIATEVVKYR